MVKESTIVWLRRHTISQSPKDKVMRSGDKRYKFGAHVHKMQATFSSGMGGVYRSSPDVQVLCLEVLTVI